MLKIFLTLYIIKTTISKFECLNGKDPIKMSNKEYLKEFSKGPCSPFMVIPCFTGSKLVLAIDCEILKKENNKIFNICGFTHCNKKFYEFWKNVPKKEYILYYPNFFSPVNIYSPFKKPGNCFAEFMKVKVDFTKPIKDSILKTKGYQIKVFGSTKSTEKESKCGDGVISNVLPLPDIIQPKITKFFDFLYKKAKKMGYKRGLTYQSLPFDWRKSYTNNRLSEIFIPNLKRIFKITKKKLILIGHSLGVRNIYYQLLNIDQEIKDLMVKNFSGIGGNFLGSWFSNTGITVGSDWWTILKYFGLSNKNTIDFMANTLSGYEARNYDPFVLFENEKWFEKIKNRMNYENDVFDDFKKSGFDFLPKKNDICSSKENNFDSRCIMGFFNSTKHYTMSVNGRKYHKKDLDKLSEEIKVIEKVKEFLEITKQKNLNKLKNPGVTYIPFVLRTYPTAEIFIWNKEIKPFLKKNKYYPPDKIIYSYGDETVSTTSTLMAPLKWAYEFDQNIPNAKPIKIIDVCSSFNQRNSVYDDFGQFNNNQSSFHILNFLYYFGNIDNKKQNDNKISKNNYHFINLKKSEKINLKSGYQMTKNEFIGMNCEDFNKKIPASATHSMMISDKYWIEFFTNILKVNEISFSEKYEKFIDQLDDEYLNSMGRDDCPQIRYKY